MAQARHGAVHVAAVAQVRQPSADASRRRRQSDRVQGTNVINARFEVDAIQAAIDQALSPAFQAALRSCVNPYGDGHSAERILDILDGTPLEDRLLIKRMMY